jgi:predicted transcriptional regulator
MRTTLTLENDVAALLARLARARRQSRKSLVNAALRAGLATLDRPAQKAAAFHTTGFDLGPSLVGSLDNVEEVLARVEGEPHR